ncbi:hypothetical protein FQ087_17070 [Sporosarcina sp. ANT_H38]|uniref:HNH endonuclease n=1 Tax=Sporosarcina sp. ANT_H38 TaxID=2597358 RepID=UPI0011F24D2E|nr:HNH endonuclease domain-containing protein [Sporosarcina sp. ANT_H38]KAA0948703.1 hypothetical protein FQ087_17070 [Sporosarcina sp. ANT_H38]
MESYSKKDNLVRAALFLEYEGKCFYEGFPVRFKEMHIDHIIPESINEQELKEVIDNLGLPEDFNVNSLYNLVPCNPNVNQVKNKNLYPIKFLGHCIHDGTSKKVSKIIKRIELLKKKNNNDRTIAKLIAILEDNVTVSELEDVYDSVSKEMPFVEEKRTSSNSYYNSKSKVQLRGYLPSYPDLKGSCLITFKNLRLRDCMISLSHEQIMTKLFDGAETNLKDNLRSFLLSLKEEEANTYFVDLGNVRMPLEEDGVIQLLEIIDDFHEIYIKKYLEIYFKFSWNKFDKVNNLRHELKLCEINKSLWFEIIEFCRKFDYEKGDSKWHIFESSGNMIKVYDKMTGDFKSFILPRIEETSIISTTEEYVSLVWTDEFFWSKRIDDFGKTKYWSPSFTYDWIIEQLIPQAIFDKQNSEQNLFRRKLSFESFKNNFDINKYVFLKDFIDENKLLDILIELQEFFTGLPRLALYKNDIIMLYKCLRDILLKSKLTIHEVNYIKDKLKLVNAVNTDLLIKKLNGLINDDEYDENLVSMFSVDLVFRCMVVIIRDCNNKLTQTDIDEIKERLNKFLKLMYREKARTI